MQLQFTNVSCVWDYKLNISSTLVFYKYPYSLNTEWALNESYGYVSIFVAGVTKSLWVSVALLLAKPKPKPISKITRVKDSLCRKTVDRQSCPCTVKIWIVGLLGNDAAVPGEVCGSNSGLMRLQISESIVRVAVSFHGSDTLSH
jgi:hypothetical protein